MSPTVILQRRGTTSTVWGTDELPYLSRYDGLLYFRINAFGAWCLGITKKYTPQATVQRIAMRLLPNLDVVAIDPPMRPGDRIILDRVAEQRSDHVWAMTQAKILTAVESGFAVGQLREFLEARVEMPLPQTASVFLDDLQRQTTMLRDLGAACWIECVDSTTAMLLANDRKLRKLCELSGANRLVFLAKDETAVRRVLRELGYMLPST